MFMMVTYPWPVASAHVELTGPQRLDSAEIGQRDAAEVTIEQRARHLEAMVCWTDLERVRFPLVPAPHCDCPPPPLKAHDHHWLTSD